MCLVLVHNPSLSLCDWHFIVQRLWWIRTNLRSTSQNVVIEEVLEPGKRITVAMGDNRGAEIGKVDCLFSSFSCDLYY